MIREHVKNKLSKKNENWEEFNKHLNNSVAGNNGFMGFFFNSQEITPALKPDTYRFNKENERIDNFDREEIEVRAVIEGQMIAKRVHAENIGLKWPLKRIIVTGIILIQLRQMSINLNNISRRSVY